jgi:ABC-type transport system involved in multi-copper enzyme maturation permease subunit
MSADEAKQDRAPKEAPAKKKKRKKKGTVGPPPAPSSFAATKAIFRLQWRRLIRGKKLQLAAGVIGLVLLAVLAARYAGEGADAAEVVQKGTTLGFFTLLVYLIPFLLTSGAIAEEVESRTFTFLSSRPVGRLAIALGKYAAGVAMAAGLLGAGMLLLHVGSFLTTPSLMIDELPATLRSTGALMLLTLLYGAICMFWGALVPEAGGIVSFLYLGIMEFALGFVPSVFRFVSMNYHATQIAGLEKRGLWPDTVPDVEPWGPLAAIVVMTLLFLFFGALTVSASEYRFGKA